MEETVSSDSIKIKQLNRWLILLVVFIVIWTIGLFVYVHNKSEPTIKPHTPVIVVDSATGKITNGTYSNLFPRAMTTPVASTNSNKPAFEVKEQYQVMDFVVINYFFIEGLIIAKNGNDDYTVMYKDHNRTLQTIVVNRELLLSPSPGTLINPASLLAP